ncbi:hypothetical protein GCM10028819_20780 [Spirosoma humi]
MIDLYVLLPYANKHANGINALIVSVLTFITLWFYVRYRTNCVHYRTYRTNFIRLGNGLKLSGRKTS